MKYLFLVCCLAFAAALSAQVVQPRGDSFAQRVSKTGGHLEEGWNIHGGAGADFSRCLGLMLQAVGISPATLKNLGFPGGDVPVSFAAFDPFFGPFSAVVAGKNRMNVGARIVPGTKWYGRFYAKATYDSILVTTSHHIEYVQASLGFRW